MAATRVLVPVLIAVVAVSFALTSGPAEAATFSVTKAADTNDGACDADCSLREAIIAANARGGPDTITIAAGTYVLTIIGTDEDDAATGDLDIAGNLTITGAGAANTIIDGSGQDRIFHIMTASTAAVSGVTVRGGVAPLGAGFFNSAGTLSITNALVTANDAVGDGGGMHSFAGILILNNTSVIDNSAARGGGIFSSAGELYVSSGAVNENDAETGGGMYNDGVAAISSSLMAGNTAEGAGGAIYNDGAVTLMETTVTSNTAIVGGGMANIGGAGFTNTSMINNTAYHGGGIYNYWGGFLTSTGATISQNTADDGGGGIFNDYGTVRLINTTVNSNHAGNGGGIHNLSSLTITGSTVSGNFAGGDGGGLFNDHAFVTLTSSTVGNNIAAAGNGGGVYSRNWSNIAVTLSTISNNSAVSGGGLYNWESTDLALENSTVSDNSGSLDGGGIFNNRAGAGLANSTVSHNSAGNGGGIYSIAPIGPFIGTLRNTIVANNSSGGDCAGNSLVSSGYNLSSDGSCPFGAAGDINNTDPMLGLLAFNGGPTATHALLDGSPAADSGGIACPPPDEDQRGVPRPQGMRCDIGAFEAPDSDADGVSDPLDEDDDNDGRSDPADPCPLYAEDYDGWQDDNGCPDPDNDSDGTCDAGQTSVSCIGSDSGNICFDPAGTLACSTRDCRNIAEDYDGFKDGDGCPEPDNDNDGFPDFTDACPGTDSGAGPDGMLGSPQDKNHNGIRDGSEAPLTTDDVPIYAFEDRDGVLDTDGCHDSPEDDWDGDGLSDEDEVFDVLTNPQNPDTDADTHLDGADNCPTHYNPAQTLPPWPVPAGDSDCDGFTNASEGTLGTDPVDQCPHNATDDAWPPDINMSVSVSVTDILFLKPNFGQAVPPAPQRYDLVESDTVNITDVVEFKKYFGLSCA